MSPLKVLRRIGRMLERMANWANWPDWSAPGTQRPDPLSEEGAEAAIRTTGRNLYG